jgi:hypothetical protein
MIDTRLRSNTSKRLYSRENGSGNDEGALIGSKGFSPRHQRVCGGRCDGQAHVCERGGLYGSR